MPLWLLLCLAAVSYANENFRGWSLVVADNQHENCILWAKVREGYSLACPLDVLNNSTFLQRAQVVTPDLYEKAFSEHTRLSQRIVWTSEMPYEDFFSEFRNPVEYDSFIETLAKDFAPFVTVKSMGPSYEGRDIKVIQISTSRGDSKRPVIVYGGLIHAREWLAGMSGMYTTYQILSKLARGDSEIKALLEVADVHAIPIQNPDGFFYTWTSASNRYWRKTRSPNKSSSCIGTDQNRNFPPRWDGNDGSSGNPCYDTYRGSAPLSEKESLALNVYLAGLGSRTVVWYDIHAYGAMFMSAFGKTKTLPSEFPVILGYLEAAQQAMKAVDGLTFSIGSIANTIYVATGSSVDNSYDSFGTIAAVTIEVRGTDFIAPVSDIVPSGKETMEGMLAVAKKVIFK